MYLSKENAIIVIALLEAVKAGKQLEFRSKYGENADWQGIAHTGFDMLNFDYRIKPEPLVRWAVTYDDETRPSIYANCESQEAAEKWFSTLTVRGGYKNLRIIKMVEEIK